MTVQLLSEKAVFLDPITVKREMLQNKKRLCFLMLSVSFCLYVVKRFFYY